MQYGWALEFPSSNVCSTIGPGNFLITKHFIHLFLISYSHGPSVHTLSMLTSHSGVVLHQGNVGSQGVPSSQLIQPQQPQLQDMLQHWMDVGLGFKNSSNTSSTVICPKSGRML